MAAGFIFTVHFFNTHLRPGRFPFDPAIFTGRVSREEFLAEHPLYFERLVREGTLDLHRTDPPPLWLTNFAKGVGYTALIVGALVIIIIVVSLFVYP